MNLKVAAFSRLSLPWQKGDRKWPHVSVFKGQLTRGLVLSLAACVASVQIASAQPALTGSGNLGSVASSLGPPTFYGAAPGTTMSFAPGRHSDWAGTFTRSGPGTSSPNIGTSTYIFTGLATGCLPPGTYVTFSDVDQSGETFNIKAYASNGSQITLPWLDGPVVKWGNPSSYPLPDYTYSGGVYTFDGGIVQNITANVAYCLRTNVQIYKIIVVKATNNYGMGFAAPAQDIEHPPVCCAGRNFVGNGSFDAGFTAFTSQFAWNPGPFPPTPFMPGQITIGNGAIASQINSTWSVWDQATQNPYFGHFLIANLSGRPNQMVWSQTFDLPNKAVCSLCARVKALGNSPVSVTLQVNGVNLPPIVVTPNGLPGVWQDLSASIGPVGGAVTIKIFATGHGGLAIDNIAVIETTTPSPAAYASIGVSTSVPSGGTFTVTATAPALPPAYGYYWSVTDVTTNHQAANPPAWWLATSTGQTLNFPGFHSNSNTLSGSSAGVFNVGDHYIISYGVWSKCTLWRASRWDITFTQDLKSRNSKPVIRQLPDSEGIEIPIVRAVQGSGKGTDK